MLWKFCQYSIWSSDRFLWVLLDDLKKDMHMFFRLFIILGKPEGFYNIISVFTYKMKESSLHLNYFLPGGLM